VQQLLQIGADVNAPSVLMAHDRTVLHVAAIQCSVQLGKLLLEYGADVHAVDSRADTPLKAVIWSPYCSADHLEKWS
jgi:ankyrin repeat protein